MQLSILFFGACLMSFGAGCSSPDAWPVAAAKEDFSQEASALESSGQSTCTITGWTAAGDMAVSRVGHQATRLQSGDVLVTGGYSAPAVVYTATAELYSPSSNSWTSAGVMSITRVAHKATLLPSGKVLITGGINVPSGPKYLSSSELYDPASKSFSATGSMSSTRHEHAAVLLNSGKVLVAGGTMNGVTSVATAELYDPATGTFIPTGSMASARSTPTATLLASGKVLVTGGHVVAGGLTQDVTDSAEIYDPSTGTWEPAGAMDEPRALHAATLLPSGKVLISGGFTYYPSLKLYSSAELYDPATGQWSSAGSGCVARRGHGAVLLSSGKVLVAGGHPANEIAEVYDPIEGTWSTVPTMSRGRDYATVTVLASGRVLVAGGNSTSTLASAEVYRAP